MVVGIVQSDGCWYRPIRRLLVSSNQTVIGIVQSDGCWYRPIRRCWYRPIRRLLVSSNQTVVGIVQSDGCWYRPIGGEVTDTDCRQCFRVRPPRRPRWPYPPACTASSWRLCSAAPSRYNPVRQTGWAVHAPY